MANFTTLLERLQKDISSAIRVTMPGKIVTYDYKTQKAVVKIDMKELYSNDVELDYPIISSVPVLFMSSGGASITAPVNAGDSCLLLFNDRDITNWLLGSKGERPASRRLHDINDAIAVMGLMSFTEISAAKNNEDLLITYDGSEVTLKPNGNIDILSASTINVKTDRVIINCSNAEVNAEDKISLKCQDAIITASERVDVNCKQAKVVAEADVNIVCENSITKSSNNATIISKNSFIQATETVNLTCKNLNASASETVVLESQNININNSQNLVLNSNNVNITSTENIIIGCKNAIITASEEITSTATKFTHNGAFVINGETKITGALTTQAGITNTGGTTSSNGITLETHTHPYIDTIGEPPIPTPSTTGTPT